MVNGQFSYLIFWEQPLPSLCFFAFAMSFLSLWVKKTPGLWGSFLAIAYAIAFYTGIATFLTIVPLFFLFLCHFLLKCEIKKWGRLFLFAIATLLSSAFIFHLVPGFANWNLIPSTQISSGAYPITLWLNFDKPWIGLIPLTLSIPLLRSSVDWRRSFKIAIPLTLIGVFSLMGLALHLGIVRWEPKLPALLPIWAFNQLFFVCMVEEAFYRGFFQKEVGRWLGTGTWARVGAIFFTSLFFALMHVRWVPSVPFLCLVFLASLLYGLIYEATQSIEASIFCHFCLNISHFLLFSYPMLASG